MNDTALQAYSALFHHDVQRWLPINNKHNTIATYLQSHEFTSLSIEDQRDIAVDIIQGIINPNINPWPHPWMLSRLNPTSNSLEITDLLLDMAATYIQEPVICWGTQARNSYAGTYVFYTKDHRFSAIASNPDLIRPSGCTIAVEPNFTCVESMEPAFAIAQIAMKRKIAYYWQTLGIKILIDMNVDPRYARLNLVGVPEGYRAYCTRVHRKRRDLIQDEYELACEHANTTQILFCVYGRDPNLADYCAERGWRWIHPEQW